MKPEMILLLGLGFACILFVVVGLAWATVSRVREAHERDRRADGMAGFLRSVEIATGLEVEEDTTGPNDVGLFYLLVPVPPGGSRESLLHRGVVGSFWANDDPPEIISIDMNPAYPAEAWRAELAMLALWRRSLTEREPLLDEESRTLTWIDYRTRQLTPEV